MFIYLELHNRLTYCHTRDGMRKYLKEDEIQRLVHAPRRLRDHLIILLLYQTGMRVGELSALRLGDVDFDSEEITISRAKRHKEGRKVPLVDPVTKQKLRYYIGDRKNRREPLFMSNKGGGISKRQVQRIIEKYSTEVGIDPDKRHAHVIRHTHAVQALKAGIDLRTLQQNLGHSSIDITAIYLTMDIDDRKEAYRRHALPGTPSHHDELTSSPNGGAQHTAFAHVSHQPHLTTSSQEVHRPVHLASSHA